MLIRCLVGLGLLAALVSAAQGAGGSTRPAPPPVYPAPYSYTPPYAYMTPTPAPAPAPYYRAPAAAAPTSSGVYAGLDVTEPWPPGPLSDARKLYEQDNALLVIHGLSVSKDQMTQLLTILRGLQQGRQTFQATAADLWAKNGPAIQTALGSVAAGQPVQAALAAVQGPLTSFSQAAAALQQANRNGAQALDTLLGPSAQGLYETLPRYLLRQQSEQSLGGLANIQEYLANQADVIRALNQNEYQLVRYWEAERLAALLRPPTAAGFPALHARVLDMLDRLYLQNNGSYSQQRATLPDQIAQYLGIPAAVRPAYFSFNEIALLLTSDQSVQIVQQLLGQTPQPVPATDAGVVQRSQQMRDAAAQARWLLLAAAMRLSVGQARAMQPLLLTAAGAMDPQQTAPDSLLAARQDSLHQLRDVLLAGTANAAVPADLQQVWLGLQDELQADRQKAVATATTALSKTREVLTVAQSALLDWPGALTGGAATPEDQLTELRGVAAQMLRGYSFLNVIRHVRSSIYPSMRLAETSTLLGEYFPPNSPALPQMQNFVLNLCSETRYATIDQWPGMIAPLMTRLMEGIGAVPGPSTVVAAARPVAWADYFSTFSDPQAPIIAAKVVTGRG